MLLRQSLLLQASALALDKEGRKPPYRSIRYMKSTKRQSEHHVNISEPYATTRTQTLPTTSKSDKLTNVMPNQQSKA